MFFLFQKMSSNKKVLIYGGKGGLGSVLVSHFKSNGWSVVSVDLAANDAADENVIVNPNEDWAKQVSNVQLVIHGSSTWKAQNAFKLSSC